MANKKTVVAEPRADGSKSTGQGLESKGEVKFRVTGRRLEVLLKAREFLDILAKFIDEAEDVAKAYESGSDVHLKELEEWRDNKPLYQQWKRELEKKMATGKKQYESKKRAK